MAERARRSVVHEMITDAQAIRKLRPFEMHIHVQLDRLTTDVVICFADTAAKGPYYVIGHKGDLYALLGLRYGATQYDNRPICPPMVRYNGAPPGLCHPRANIANITPAKKKTKKNPSKTTSKGPRYRPPTCSIAWCPLNILRGLAKHPIYPLSIMRNLAIQQLHGIRVKLGKGKKVVELLPLQFAGSVAFGGGGTGHAKNTTLVPGFTQNRQPRLLLIREPITSRKARWTFYNFSRAITVTYVTEDFLHEQSAYYSPWGLQEMTFKIISKEHGLVRTNNIELTPIYHELQDHHVHDQLSYAMLRWHECQITKMAFNMDARIGGAINFAEPWRRPLPSGKDIKWHSDILSAMGPNVTPVMFQWTGGPTGTLCQFNGIGRLNAPIPL